MNYYILIIILYELLFFSLMHGLFHYYNFVIRINIFKKIIF